MISIIRDLILQTRRLVNFIVLEGESKEFSFNFKIENIKLIPGAYSVAISCKNLARFYNTNYKLTYFIALEPDSVYS